MVNSTLNWYNSYHTLKTNSAALLNLGVYSQHCIWSNFSPDYSLMFWSSLFITFFFEESDFQYLYNKQTYSWFFIWWNHDIRILCWFKEYSFPTTFLCIYATKLKWNLLALEMDRFTTKKFTLLKNSSEKHFTCQMLQFINLLFNGSEVSHCFTIFICP